MNDPIDEHEAGKENDQNNSIHRHLIPKIDETEKVSTRHTLNAVFAAGKFRLQRKEIHHLRKRQRDHREINALTADRQRAGDKPANRGRCCAGQDRKLGRETPHLGGVRRHIAGPAEIERMAKRQQADIPDQKIEGAGKQGKAHRLHQEQRIGDEGCDHQRRNHDNESDGLALRAQRRRLLGEWISDAFHHPLRPNKPAGRTSSTMAMMTKMTVFEASGKKTLVRPSMTPNPKPVMIAPRIEPMPPMTTTAKTTMISSEPICGDTL